LFKTILWLAVACVSDGSGALFSLLIAHGFEAGAINKEKKREWTARPVVFAEGHAQMNHYGLNFIYFKIFLIVCIITMFKLNKT
jgi:hypothetical protein